MLDGLASLYKPVSEVFTSGLPQKGQNLGIGDTAAEAILEVAVSFDKTGSAERSGSLMGSLNGMCPNISTNVT